ncbi:MAG: hypothetical protein DSM107014_05125 [Gomphosphaeria aponina SAG 52.96 = DSM 107014]|uniref:Uncharacterized protein n=1 Tax=Gomphosphaeria aponina SAG 52.96 = DSM 107014 TaxID=1521640 RepID=A0A941JSS3_9CHRO|nr:hypothetical protein [Gomphosphaeria aponina SAG 52.96 = DSM 107014]
MTPQPEIMKSVEKLNYRVTVGDVAANAGLEINLAQRELLALASDAGGHLQVAESGDIVYLFPKNFRTILRNKYWRLAFQEWGEKVWKVVFFLIRISFGIVLIASIILMAIAITMILLAMSSDNEGEGGGGRNSSRGGRGFFWFNFSDFFYFFGFNGYNNTSRRVNSGERSKMNFLEAVFSFLFGDGLPNPDLEERRWQEIGTVIRNNRGAVVAEQIAPYLDRIEADRSEDEDYILPVLIRFNGYPEVSAAGEIIYYFPELQVTALERKSQPVSSYLREQLWQFSQAGSGQIMLASGLGAVNIILALVLGSLLKGEIGEQLGGLVAFVDGIYWLLLGYGIAFLLVPLIRYFWIKWRNGKIKLRNQQREKCSLLLNRADARLQQKIEYASQFAAQKVIGDEDITYSTETDLLEQDIKRADKIDAEWQRRLES